MLFIVFRKFFIIVLLISVFKSNEHFVAALLGDLLQEGNGEGLLGLNLSGTLGNILGKSDDPQTAAKTASFFGNLHKLLYNILTDSPDVTQNKYLARSIVNQIRGGGFCSLKPGNSYHTQFGGIVSD